VNSRKLFPLGKAYGQAFCNRSSETKKLIGNIESGKHTFLVAPRRYGKSSLCENAFLQLNCAWSKIDFYIAVTEKDAERALLNGVTELIGKSIGSVEKLGHVLKKYATRLRPKLTVGTDPVKLELSLSEENSSPAENIAEALLILEHLLREKQKQAVLLLDEFQEIGNMPTGRGIEGAIRHVAQETQNLSIIFCGSNPHLLKAMFEDERRPLYKLCRKIALNRIEKTHYQAHIHAAAQQKWGTILPADVFEGIMAVTERHPYYVNYLCDELFSECTKLPTLNDLESAWQLVVEEEQSDLMKDFSALPDNQRKLMRYIANHDGQSLYGTEISKKTDVPGNSVSRTIAGLIEKDYIEKIDEHYRLIVPVYKQLLHENY
jgi:AAA+ ATPase superfamily predicted ATPase